MMKIEILFFVIEIGGSKSENMLFHDIFLNKDISITIQDTAMKCWMNNLHIHLEGSVSQIFDLGPSFYFM